MNRNLVFLIAVTVAVPVAGARADVVIDWNKTIYDVIQWDGMKPDNKANPGWSTRSIAIMNGAIYDIFQAVNRTHAPFLVNTQAVPDTSLDAAVHQAAYELLVECYPGEASALLNIYDDRMSLIAPGAAKTNGMTLGTQIAQVYMASRANDKADEMHEYTPLEGAGKWRPDPYNLDQEVWGPGWGHVKPFAIPNTADFIGALPPIPDLNSQQYADAFQMVYEYGALNSVVRTQEQEEISLFWAYDRPGMGPPPRLFVRNVWEIAEAAGNSPEQNARLFALASTAMADAAIAAWDAKFEYNFWRPVAAIHEADTDGNPLTLQDAAWKPLGAPGDNPNDDADDFTPPFPAWTSGHATMGGAVFKAIELFYGTNSFGDIVGIPGAVYALNSEEDGSGGTRYFTTFTQSALLDVGAEDSPEGENGMSRIYLGIHWIFDQQDGITLGNDIAYWVTANRFHAVPEPGSILLALTAIGLAGTMFRRRSRKP